MRPAGRLRSGKIFLPNGKINFCEFHRLVHEDAEDASASAAQRQKLIRICMGNSCFERSSAPGACGLRRLTRPSLHKPIGTRGQTAETRGDDSFHVGGVWRRVPESNRCTRICNPSGSIEIKGLFCKQPLFVHDQRSGTYRPNVNGLPAFCRQRKTAGEAATSTDGNSKVGLSIEYSVVPSLASFGRTV